MSTVRVTERAWGNLTTRWLLGISAVAALSLLTGCATSLADTSPELIDYCAESRGPAIVDTASGCIPRP
jgi:hypothetical protein